MSYTLLLRVVAPMQSWGVQSDFTHRDTGLEPSKSGVIGLLCAALGKPRDEEHADSRGKPSLAELASLRMGVRVDREGLLQRDYHTARDVLTAGGTNLKRTELSERYYLADAAFLVGLEGNDRELLAQLNRALHNPHWLLFLGRKAFPPSEPMWTKPGVVPLALEDALHWSQHPRLRPARHLDDPGARLVLEARPGVQGQVSRHDRPVSFVRGHRQFLDREMLVDYMDRPPED